MENDEVKYYTLDCCLVKTERKYVVMRLLIVSLTLMAVEESGAKRRYTPCL